MERDLAIVYKTELYKINKTIDRLKTVGLDTTKYENLIYEIDETCCQSNKEDLKKSFDTPFMVDYLEANYSKAINELKKIEHELSKYEVYLKVRSFTNVLENIISNNNLEEKEILELEPKLIGLLNSLKKSNTLDYQVEGKLIDNIYKVTYYLLKEEVKLELTSLYEELSKDSIHTTYLDKEISSELDSLDKNDVKNNDIFNRRDLIDSNGINSHYLDYELLYLIVDSKTKEKTKEDITELYQLYKTIKVGLFNRSNRIDNCYNWAKDYREERVSLKKPFKYIKNIGSIILSASVITTLFGGAYRLAKSQAYSHPDLKSTTITTYDTRNNSEETTEPFYSDKTEGTIVTEYEPYQKKLGGFYRYVTTYNLGEVNDLSNEEILNLNFEGLGIEGNRQRENKDTLTYENVYDNIYYIITKTNVDENDCLVSEGNLVGYIIVIELLAVIVYFILLFIKSIKTDEISIGLISGIKNIKEDLELIKYYTTEEKRYMKEGNKLVKEVEELLNTYDKEIRELIKYVDFTCKYGNDKVSENLRETLKDIYNNLSNIEKYTDSATIKNMTDRIKKRTREI